jgi:hypothetical protein
MAHPSAARQSVTRRGYHGGGLPHPCVIPAVTYAPSRRLPARRVTRGFP